MELSLDPNIRFWVFLPIFVITILTGMVRHYCVLLMASPKKVTAQQIQDGQALLRLKKLRDNGHLLHPKAFAMRKHFFIDETTGYLKTNTSSTPIAKNQFTDPEAIMEMVKDNAAKVLPTIIIGGWINWVFSGFLTTKLPFPLTLRFKQMLQRGVDLESLDASWVSSVSWYVLNVFGLKGIYALVLGENNSADQGDQMSGVAVAHPADSKMVFKDEWETLHVTFHKWSLENVDIHCS